MKKKKGVKSGKGGGGGAGERVRWVIEVVEEGSIRV